MSIVRRGLSSDTQVYAYEDQIDTMQRVVSPPLATTTWTVVPPLILGPPGAGTAAMGGTPPLTQLCHSWGHDGMSNT